ncbi:extracellular solute-binding protein [uncultured Albimonas sp.]|uniref:ABC transporter substrate-binding protein n=1 Tax=uncultured Albimonas sp. TaxID=1331701 RepID=UPI0030ECC813|tara:strand:+ start:1861 stop:3123 length:1263 start_codon:yes stop_codon:yes gene_type:complete
MAAGAGILDPRGRAPRTGAEPSAGPRAPAVRRVRAPLRVLGTSVTQIEPIRRLAEADLGLPLELITLDGASAQRRGALFPSSFDVYDQWFHDLDLIWPAGSIQPLDVRRIAAWDAVGELPLTGRIGASGRAAPGGDPSRRLWVQPDGALGAAPSERISMAPTVHNADAFAVVGADPASVDSWGALLDPAWGGRVLLQSDAAIGCFDMMLALRARGEMDPPEPGDLSLEEIDDLVARLRRLHEAGHFRAAWTDEAEAVDALRLARREGAPMIGSLWWSGLIALRAEGVPVAMATPREGYRGWFGGLALSARAQGWAADAAYDYINWWLDGAPGAILARNGAYMTNAEAVRGRLTAAEWAFWYDGEPARTEIRDAYGRVIFAPGERREGGAYAQRMSRIAVWNTVMTEHNYLVRRWETALGV